MSAAEQSPGNGLFTIRTETPELSACYFYHTMELPGHGVVNGEWDLRNSVDTYLGNVSVSGKTVLELGTASGFLCFEMERRGANVIGYDLDPSLDWDIVPYANEDVDGMRATRAQHIGRINNSWWLSRAAYGASARMLYGTIYDIPKTIGHIDVCTFGAILLHLREPLRALQSAASVRPDTIIVTEMERQHRFPFIPERTSHKRSPLFLPNAATSTPNETWWSFSIESIVNLLGIAGYECRSVLRHTQRYRDRDMKMFTVVAGRKA